jgi:hypothetical protein
MNKKQLYTIESTLKPNMLVNYNRIKFDNKRRISNKERADNLTYRNIQTENFDKYYDTKFISLYMSVSIKDFVYDEDDF